MVFRETNEIGDEGCQPSSILKCVICKQGFETKYDHKVQTVQLRHIS